MRKTKNPRTALERLETAYGLQAPTDQTRPASRLAALVFLLRRMGADRAAVQDAARWAPALLPAKGIAGWEEAQLAWVRYDEEVLDAAD